MVTSCAACSPPSWPLSCLAPTSGAAVESPRSNAARQATLETSLLVEINAVRRDHGLKPLATSAKLAKAARQHTREMGVDGYFEHESFDSTPFWKRIERWYPSKKWRSWSVGENLVYSSPTSPRRTPSTCGCTHPSTARTCSAARGVRSASRRSISESAPGEYDGEPVTIVTADFGTRRLAARGAPGRGSRPGSRRCR